MTILSICGLEIYAKLGIHPWEQQLPQKIIINLELAIKFPPQHDCLSATVDYTAITETITEHFAQHSYQLLETLTAQLSECIYTKFPNQWLKLQVRKPQAYMESFVI